MSRNSGTKRRASRRTRDRDVACPRPGTRRVRRLIAGQGSRSQRCGAAGNGVLSPFPAALRVGGGCCCGRPGQLIQLQYRCRNGPCRLHRSWTYDAIAGSQPGAEAIWRDRRPGRSQLPGRRRRDVRPARSQRRRQDHAAVHPLLSAGGDLRRGAAAGPASLGPATARCAG